MDETISPSRLRIATFNLESLGERPRAAASLNERIRILRPQITRLRADIVCLQEIDGQKPGSKNEPRILSALDALLEGTEYAGFNRATTLSISGNGVRDRHNLVTLSRFPILEQRQIQHDLIPPAEYRMVTAEPPAREAEAVEWDRPFLYTEIDLGQARPLHLLNVHLRAPRAAFVPGQKIDRDTWRTIPGWAEGFFLAAVKQAGQALEIRLFIDPLWETDDQPLIAIAGDFNAEDHEPPLRIIMGDEEDLGNGALTPMTLAAIERSLSESQRFSVIHAGRAQMVDHILTSRSLLAWYRESEIHNETLGDEFATPAVVRGAPDSFHAPVVAEFNLSMK